MTGSPFFDSNTLLHLVSNDTAKADRANTLLRAGGIVSVQVLNEVVNVSTRKFRASWPQTDTLLALVRANCEVVPLTEATHDLGRQLAERHRLQVYDAMVVAAALLADADTLYSEDMHDGLRVRGQLTLRNPFRAQPH
ncbi:PIN domain-containing protein [Xylophilus sp.]|uniref:PIN domain-containing protein n=1 Tax=Xylophilus sp. TaxID=2653893 RepID=UPI0013B7BE0D|nr:PIN domain-containing protein [Xylophilus sp.]KAF1045794.1 MAG: hypothetical protein GAK38_02781 [Xylophilus sp.]